MVPGKTLSNIPRGVIQNLQGAFQLSHIVNQDSPMKEGFRGTDIRVGSSTDFCQDRAGEITFPREGW